MNLHENDISTQDSLYLLYEDSSKSMRYSFQGPVYQFGKIIDTIKEPMYTTAPSKDKAINNFKSRIKKQLKLLQTTVISIDKRDVEEIISDIDMIPNSNIKYCEFCGTQLNPMNQCPICDLGDTD